MKSKAVLAFYYPWYWTRQTSGHWSMWDYGGTHNPDVFVGPKRRDVPCPHYPAHGLYDSGDPGVIKRHFESAGDMGLDGLIVSWWGKGSILNRPFEKLLDYAKEMDTKISAYYEIVPSIPFKHKNTALDIIEFVREYGSKPGFFKSGGRPVVFFYRRIIKQHTISQWAEILKAVRGECGALFVADTMDERLIELFDGAHTYSPYESCLWRRHPGEDMRKLVLACKVRGKKSALSVMPGFDDTRAGNRMSLKRRLWQYAVHFKRDVVVERNSGETYSTFWQWASDAGPDWILVCSFNEWIEGTEIEPSVEHGTKYVEMTKEFTARFKGAF